VVRNSPIPENFPEDLESDFKDAQKLHWALDPHAEVNCMVEEVEQGKESQQKSRQKKREQVMAKKAEEEAAKVEVEWVARRVEVLEDEQ